MTTTVKTGKEPGSNQSFLENQQPPRGLNLPLERTPSHALGLGGCRGAETRLSCQILKTE